MNQDAVAQAWVPCFVMSVAKYELKQPVRDVVRVDLADVRGDIVRLQATTVHGKQNEADMARYLEAKFVTGTHVVVSKLPLSAKEAVKGVNVIGLFNISKEISVTPLPSNTCPNVRLFELRLKQSYCMSVVALRKSGEEAAAMGLKSAPRGTIMAMIIDEEDTSMHRSTAPRVFNIVSNDLQEHQVSIYACHVHIVRMLCVNYLHGVSMFNMSTCYPTTLCVQCLALLNL